ncbi:MAG: hypothetical protein V8R14_03275 [Clostridia bacterium]
MCDEEKIEEFLENGSLDDGSIAAGIAKRRIFPCCFGSALKMQGVDELLEIVSQFSLQKRYPDSSVRVCSRSAGTVRGCG